jgi:metallo-beta-lactamase class B
MFKRSIHVAVLCALGASTAMAQSTPTVETLVASAKAYAGTDWMGTFQRLCVPTVSAANRVVPTVDPADFPTTTLPTPPGGTPPRANWYSPPAQIGDNFYFLGTRNHNTYALVSKEGREIILIDGNFEYATEDEIHEGLRLLGLNPKNVKYQIIAHAHGDHDGGAHLTQAAIPGITIVYGEGDWPSVLARTGPHATRSGPENDGTDNRVITVGDVSVKIITMPGHTPGTLSFLFEFKDKENGEPIRVAYPGGTAISFTNPDPAFYDQYIASARKFAKAAADYGANALLSNHTEFDNAFFKAHAAENLREGGKALRTEDGDTPNPYFVGQRRVLNYMGVVELCAMAAKLRSTGSL